jgi:hypothetical protein
MKALSFRENKLRTNLPNGHGLFSESRRKLSDMTKGHPAQILESRKNILLEYFRLNKVFLITD